MPPGRKDSLAQRTLGSPWAKARTTCHLGQKGDALGYRLLQGPPAQRQGKALQGDRAMVQCALPPPKPGLLGGSARPWTRAGVPALSPPWGLVPPPPWREACLSLVWHSAELGPQRPHCAHPTDPLEDGTEAQSSEAPPLGGTVWGLWRGSGPHSQYSLGVLWPLRVAPRLPLLLGPVLPACAHHSLEAPGGLPVWEARLFRLRGEATFFLRRCQGASGAPTWM